MATRSGHNGSPCVSISHHSVGQGDHSLPHAAFSCSVCLDTEAAHNIQSEVPETRVRDHAHKGTMVKYLGQYCALSEYPHAHMQQ